MSDSVNTEIANLALTKLGAARILSIDDNVKAARAVRASWDLIRDSELRAHNWAFAIRRVTIPKLEETPAWGFNNAYAAPADLIRIIQVDDLSPGVDLTDYRFGQGPSYQIEGAADGYRIYTDVAPPLKLRYIARVEPAGLWDTSFKVAFACRLAMDLCEELTQSTGKRQLAQTEYTAAIREAVRNNAIEKPPEPLPDDTWILSRF